MSINAVFILFMRFNILQCDWSINTATLDRLLFPLWKRKSKLCNKPIQTTCRSNAITISRLSLPTSRLQY